MIGVRCVDVWSVSVFVGPLVELDVRCYLITENICCQLLSQWARVVCHYVLETVGFGLINVFGLNESHHGHILLGC